MSALVAALRTELRLLSRDRGLRLALCGSLAALLAVALPMLARAAGSPAGAVPVRVLESPARAAAVLCLLVAPWALARQGETLGRDGWVRWTAAAAASPAAAVAARLASGWLVVLLLWLLPLPVLVVGREMIAAAAPGWGGHGGLALLLLPMVPAIVALRLERHGALARLGRAYLAAAALVAAVLGAGQGGPALAAAISGAATLALAAVAAATAPARLLRLPGSSRA